MSLVSVSFFDGTDPVGKYVGTGKVPRYVGYDVGKSASNLSLNRVVLLSPPLLATTRDIVGVVQGQ